jgi:hypothetical protein
MPTKSTKRKRKPDPRGTETIYVRVPAAVYAAIKAKATWPHTIASVAGEALAKAFPDVSVPVQEVAR